MSYIYSLQCQLQFCARFSPGDLTYLFITSKLIHMHHRKAHVMGRLSICFDIANCNSFTFGTWLKFQLECNSILCMRFP